MDSLIIYVELYVWLNQIILHHIFFADKKIWLKVC